MFVSYCWRKESLVSTIRNDYPIMVHVNTDQEEVANLFQKYRSIVLPVVDDLDIILGVITIDDVVDVVVEEANEDMLKLAGTSGDDLQNDKLIQGSIFYSLLHRLPWLFCNHYWWYYCIRNNASVFTIFKF